MTGSNPTATATEMRERLTLAMLTQLARVPALGSRLHHRLGRMHAAQGRNEDAIACYERSLARREPRNGSLYHHLGLAQHKTGRLHEAKQSFRRAIEREPAAGWSYQGLGETLLELGRLDKAEQALRQAIVVQPDNPWPYFHLAQVRMQQGRRADALDLTIQASAQSASGPLPVVPFSPDWLTASLITPERIQGLRDIVRQHPDATKLTGILARMLTLSGEYREATARLEGMTLAQWRQDYPEHAVKAADGAPVTPAFLIIGQGKAGTMALYSHLCQHPQIAPAIVARAIRFLGLPPFMADCSSAINTGRYQPVAPEIEQRLRAWFAPHQAALAAFLARLDAGCTG